MLLARAWPDPLDQSTIAMFLAVALLLPALGYFFLVADIRAYMRAVRGILIVVRDCMPGVPAWARVETPACLRSLGLSMGCSEEEVKRAYRRQAELLHPDRGGDRRRFMGLQRQFEQALLHVRDSRPDWSVRDEWSSRGR